MYSSVISFIYGTVLLYYLIFLRNSFSFIVEVGAAQSPSFKTRASCNWPILAHCLCSELKDVLSGLFLFFVKIHNYTFCLIITYLV